MIYLQDPDVTIHQGDVVDELRKLPAESVHMCCTSPPFYGLRDYGTGTWEGGDEGCDHAGPPKQSPASTLAGNGHGAGKQLSPSLQAQTEPMRDTCGKCGARRVDQQIGLEATPDLWVARLVEVFREVRRVLRSDGTLWLEVGDSYAANRTYQVTDNKHTHVGNDMGAEVPPGYKPKDLIGAPWLLAFALRADGWYLRSEIIWSKPNPMPESVTDRPTTSHSRVFLLAKQPRYFYDADAIREPHQSYDHHQRYAGRYSESMKNGGWQERVDKGATVGISPDSTGRNRRSVWTLTTQPYPEAHFATWPEALCRDMILAGTSERGVCPECGAPWERVVERGIAPGESANAPGSNGQNFGGIGTPAMGGGQARQAWLDAHPSVTTGWQPTCECRSTLSETGLPTAEPAAEGEAPVSLSVPATVLDPFGGSGTTAHVARKLGRRAILIELNADYCQLAANRLAQQTLLA